MEIDSKPVNLDAVDRDIMQLQIEREALKKEKDKASQDRLEKLEEELANLQEESTQLTVVCKFKYSIFQQNELKIQLPAADKDKRQSYVSRCFATSGNTDASNP